VFVANGVRPTYTRGIKLMRQQALSPELQRLLNEPLSEPPARAREHWKALDKAMERLDRARVQQASYDVGNSGLREELGLVRQRDQRALGEALAAGQPEPEPEAAAIEAEIERNAQRSSAMLGVIGEEQRRVVELVLRSRDSWRRDLERILGDKAAAYRAKLVELEQARAELVEEVQTAGWLHVFPQTGGQVQTAHLAGDRRPVDPLTGRPEPIAVPQRMFSEVLSDLRRDSEQLPLCGPVEPTADYLRWLNKNNVMLERVDAEGGVHPASFSKFPAQVARLLPWRG
jgi:hypothetical protein